MQEFHIIGITDSRELSFSKEVQALIARSHVFGWKGTSLRVCRSGFLYRINSLDRYCFLFASIEHLLFNSCYAVYQMVVFVSGDPFVLESLPSWWYVQNDKVYRLFGS